MTMPLYALIAMVGASAPTGMRDRVQPAFASATSTGAARSASSKAPVLMVIGAATPARRVAGLDGLFRTRPADPSAVPPGNPVLASANTAAKPVLRTSAMSTLKRRPAVLIVDKAQQLRRRFQGCNL